MPPLAGRVYVALAVVNASHFPFGPFPLRHRNGNQFREAYGVNWLIMIILDFLWALLAFGLPVGITSWALLHRLYRSGALDRDSNRGAMKIELKKLKQNWRDDKQVARGFFENKWMRFGGGFYGIAALTTFIMIELGGAVSFVFDFPGFTELLKDGLISFVINVLINQFGNFISALFWFAYWADGGASIFIWIIASYLGFLAGNQLARYPPGNLFARIAANRKD